ncbi:membrane-targeted effector domain-containing toxin [Pseudomonas sp. CCI3.2]|uniref:membrane-targeted effector domain-containing toxin n=1 Tax=unclassified Pseudomonas TaxID=196821 RepID=UPI002AC92255|nr:MULTISPECIES: membrane-targeted effector domain-containing toxin [unclassified Pseudomonas]MEB0079229.1 membrane-targeted effector domain-containing toxin [Pseudomonas sp. MH10out]MEB0103230.1 membrane-targeted effector domain-containing toxin [Pseudomonas sp. CCI3.2]MEB0130712.1 membrane-targeted effector domain-containing toxin [Pseudomonas sp. CCI2.4]MEB0156785.1 membrane-targeted effector domain-containing toxin [Pseudomonas sp. AH2 (2023)]MEB0167184.1 membrane-targeted effector domain-
MQTLLNNTSVLLSRLTALSTTLTNELAHLPEPEGLTLQEIHNRIDFFWSAPSAQNTPRRELFIAGIGQAMRDEVALKIADGSLHSIYNECLPLSATDSGAYLAPELYSLQLKLNDQNTVELAGALVIIAHQGPTLLALPGYGVEGFSSRALLLESLTHWVNNSALRSLLLNNVEQRFQALLLEIETDPDLFLEPFDTLDWQLTPIADTPFEHVFDRQLDKQRADISHAFEGGAHLLNQSIRMTGLFGPAAMLALRDISSNSSKQRKALPDWFTLASREELLHYGESLKQYEQARAALSSLLGGASSPEQFATERLRARIENDLGHDLNPQHLMISTWRTLPLSNEPYKVTRSLTQLALYGLHPGDMDAGSAFLTWSTVTLQGQPLGSAYPGLTNGYIGELIQTLDLRSAFAPVQREAYGSPNVQRVMRDVTRQQVTAMAYAAKLQGHILPRDFNLIEAFNQAAGEATGGAIGVQQVKLNNHDVLSNLLLFRQEDAQGQLERLVMFMAENPRGRQFQGFDNENQLRQELTSWSAFPDMSEYLLKQVPATQRIALEKQLSGLKQKPQPPADFITFTQAQAYDEGLRALVNKRIGVMLAEQEQHTPHWYLNASASQRQELVALEDAINAAHVHYEAKAHAQIQTFDDYVHRRATQKINELLGTAEGEVDPDEIMIISSRETLNYTQMLRNGYDDSVNPITTNALTDARFKGPDGIDLTPLTAEKVARSVHGAWLSDQYVAHIKSTLLNAHGTGYTYRRRTSLLITQLQMKAAALRSHLKNEINAHQYQWLKASIEQMHVSEPDTRRRHPLYPLQFKLNNPLIATDVPELGNLLDFLPLPGARTETALGCHVLTPDHTGNARDALLYTPNAPDGLDFRLLGSFVDTLKHHGMSDYYKDRCRISANRKLAFFLADMKAGGNSQPPILPDSPLTDLYDQHFNQIIQRKVHDVEDTISGRNDLLRKLIWTSVELIATAVTLPFPPASFAVGALLAMRDSLQALEAFSDGDREAASGYLLSSLFNGLGAAGDLHSGLKGFGHVLRNVAGNGGKKQVLNAAKHLQRMSPPVEQLRPMQVHGEQFWAGSPTPNAHAPLFRMNVRHPDELIPTGQFAEKNSAGVWQPLRRETDPAIPQGTLNQAYAVSVSLRETTPIASGHAKGVTLVQGQHYIELQGLTFRVQFDARMRCWHIIDGNNPFAFFGKQPVYFDSNDQWQLVDLNLRGGGRPNFHPLEEEAANPPSAASELNSYELPPNMRPYTHGIIDPSAAQLGLSGLGIEQWMEQIYADLRKAYSGFREALYRDASAFFEQVRLPVRPDLPLFDVAARPETLLNGIFGKTNGLVISEAPRSVVSKQWLIDNMPLLVEQKVEVLYIEHLFTDLHPRKLAKYKKLGSKTKSGSHEIKYHLKQLDGGALDNQSKEYDYYHLIKAAHKHGIEVKPFNSAVSYPSNNNPVAIAADDPAAAQKMSNFFGSNVIAADTTALPQRRWIALLDQKMANTWRQVPGIAELNGAISVRFEGLPAGSASRVSRDAAGSIAGDPFAKADFTLQMADFRIATLTVTPPTAPTKHLDDALYRLFEGNAHSAADSVTFAGSHGFQLDETGLWQRVDPDAWPAEHSLTAIQQSLLDANYDLPIDLRPTMHELANFRDGGLHDDYAFNDEHLTQVRDAFFDLRRQLQQDAQQVIAVALPPRPTLPNVEPGTTIPDFIDTLYGHTSGAVVGEAHGSIASKQFIIDNLPHLSRKQVKTLYMEHLQTDLHQADLDRFADTGQMSKTLLHDLKKLDRDYATDPNKVYTFENLVIRAREQGLEVRAIDCSASYHLEGLKNKAPTTRQQMMNFFASRTIRKHQEVMGSHNWIALVGNTHANTFQKIVPGFAELEGAIGIRVIDVGPSSVRGPFRDPGEHLVENHARESIYLQSDYRLEMQTLDYVTESAVVDRTPLVLSTETELTEPGMFLIDESIPDHSVIVHRSKDTGLERIVISRDEQGLLYVEHPAWESIHRQPYDDLWDLVQALEDLNLIRVG